MFFLSERDSQAIISLNPAATTAITTAAAESSGVPTLFTYLTGSVTTPQMKYFKHWDKLLDMESKASEQALNHISNQHGVWTNPRNRGNTMFSVQATTTVAVTTGRCQEEQSMSGQQLDAGAEGYGGKMKHMWTLTQTWGDADGSYKSCLDLDFVIGDRVSLSIEKNFAYSGNCRGGGGDDGCDTNIDIEDMAAKCAGVVWDVTNVEPHVVSGEICHISNETITIGISHLSKRLQR